MKKKKSISYQKTQKIFSTKIIVECYPNLKKEMNIVIGSWDMENTKQKRLQNELLMTHETKLRISKAAKEKD